MSNGNKSLFKFDSTLLTRPTQKSFECPWTKSSLRYLSYNHENRDKRKIVDNPAHALFAASLRESCLETVEESRVAGGSFVLEHREYMKPFSKACAAAMKNDAINSNLPFSVSDFQLIQKCVSKNSVLISTKNDLSGPIKRGVYVIEKNGVRKCYVGEMIFNRSKPRFHYPFLKVVSVVQSVVYDSDSSVPKVSYKSQLYEYDFNEKPRLLEVSDYQSTNFQVKIKGSVLNVYAYGYKTPILVKLRSD